MWRARVARVRTSGKMTVGGHANSERARALIAPSTSPLLACDDESTAIVWCALASVPPMGRRAQCAPLTKATSSDAARMPASIKETWLHTITRAVRDGLPRCEIE